MPDITEDVIDGAMFLRKCSREEALAWLTSPVSDEELDEYKKGTGFDAYLARNLKFPADEIKNVIRSKRRWDAATARFLDEIERSQIITAKDMAVTINARDDD